jgi:transposase
VKVKTLGIDLAKETFGLHGVDPLGRVVVHRRITRKQLLGFLVKLEPCLVGMEAVAQRTIGRARSKSSATRSS